MTSKLTAAKTLVELVEIRAIRNSEELAYIFIDENNNEKSLTYQELSHQAKQIAVYLQHFCKKGDRVILMYPPGLTFITAYFGCLYAGVIAVPTYPPTEVKLAEKLDLMTADCTPTLLLMDTSVANKLSELDILRKENLEQRQMGKIIKKNITQPRQFGQIKWLNTEKLSDQSIQGFEKALVDPADIAFLQYTSGSTGHPKGVLVSHKNLMHNINLIYVAFRMHDQTKMASWLPHSHDMGLIGCFLTAIYGGFPLYFMAPMQFIRRPYHWLKLISEKKITVSGAPNFAYDYCVNKVTEAQKGSLDLSCVELLFNGAEPVRADTIHRFTELFTHYGLPYNALFPVYGLAEATLFVSGRTYDAPVSYLYVDEKELLKNKVIAVKENNLNSKIYVSSGQPYQRVAIVDPEKKQALNEDEVGEIWVASDSIPEGYWNKPIVSKEIFHNYLPHDETRSRYLRTGDLGFLHNNQLYITGRLKDLIIIHGKNYYPQDIEHTVIKSHSIIKAGQCVAFSVEVNSQEKLVIVAEINPKEKDNHTALEEACNIIAENILSDYEVPVYKIVLGTSGTIAKTTSGKVRRKYVKEKLLNGELHPVHTWDTIKAQARPGGSNNKENDKNSSAVEKKINKIYEEVFTYPVDVNEPFLKLGGDSLIAAQLASRISEEFKIEFDPQFFYTQAKTNILTEVESLLQNNITYQQFVPIKPFPKARKDQIPLTDSEQLFWMIGQIEHDYRANFNVSMILKFKGVLDKPALIKSLQDVLYRHEPLHTTFIVKDHELYQSVKSNLPPIIFEDFSDLNFQQQKQAMLDLKKEIRKPFVNLDEFLLRIYLIKLSEDSHQLLLDFHHSIVDGWSAALLINELEIFYNAFSVKKIPNIKSLPVCYTDYTLWKQGEAQQKNENKQLEFWINKLNNAPSISTFPRDKPRPKHRQYRASSIHITIPSGLLNKIKTLGQQEHCSLFMILLTSCYLLLGKYTQQNDFVIATPVARRPQAVLELMIGCFTSPLPLRSILNWKFSFKEYLSKVRENVLESFKNQDIGLIKIMEALHIVPQGQMPPLFQIMFILQSEIKTANLNHLSTSQSLHNMLANLDLLIECKMIKGSLKTEFIYASELFEKETIEKLANAWLNLLAEIVLDPNQSLANLLIAHEAVKR